VVGRDILMPPSSNAIPLLAARPPSNNVTLLLAAQPLNRELILLAVKDMDNAIPVVEHLHVLVHLHVQAPPDVPVLDALDPDVLDPDALVPDSDQQNGAQRQ
jgi:hypothetical protein